MKQAITAAVVITMDRGYSVHRPGYVIIDGDSIQDVGSGEPPKGSYDERLDLGSRLIMPGLVNSHAHTPMILTRGMCEGVSLFTMDGFLNTLRYYESFLDADLSEHTVSASLAEMIRTGTTTFADQYFYADRIFRKTDASGLRGLICYGIVELGDEQRRKDETRMCEEFLEMCQKHPVIRGWVGPHAFFVDNSLDLIDIELRLARKYDTGFHIHFATSNEENDYCMEHYGCSAIEKMRDLGILDVPILAAHAITVSEEDMDIIKGHPFTPVMCPSSSMRSGFPAAPVKSYIDHGINVAIGTDNVCAANSHDMFREMDIGAKLIIHREHDVKALTARDMVEMATMGGAKAVQLEDEIGSLEKGKKADLIALDLSDIGWRPFCGEDYYTQIVYSISGMSVTDSMVNGRWLMRDRSILTIDVEAAMEDTEWATEQLKKRIADA